MRHSSISLGSMAMSVAVAGSGPVIDCTKLDAQAPDCQLSTSSGHPYKISIRNLTRFLPHSEPITKHIRMQWDGKIYTERLTH